MIRAYDSSLEYSFVGEGTPPYFCPRCGTEIEPKDGWFDHPNPHCYDFTPLSGSCARFLYDNFQGVELDTLMEGHLVQARIPMERVVVPSPTIQISKLMLRDVTAYWNRAGQSPLWIFGGPGYTITQKSKLDDGAVMMRAAGAERLVIDALESERIPYLSWNGKELITMDVFSKNGKVYFGYMRSLDASRLRIDRVETDIGRLAIVKEV